MRIRLLPVSPIYRFPSAPTVTVCGSLSWASVADLRHLNTRPRPVPARTVSIPLVSTLKMPGYPSSVM